MENFGKENIVALKSAPTMITIYSGKRIMNKVESICGRILKLDLHDKAKKLIYITESGSVVLYNMSTELSSKIFQLDSIDNFIDILQVEDNFMMICKDEDDKLQVNKSLSIYNFLNLYCQFNK